MKSLFPRWLCALPSLLLGSLAIADDTSPCDQKGTPERPIISFTANSDIRRIIEVSAKIAGSPAHGFQIDTGSAATIVPLSILPADIQAKAKTQKLEDYGYMSSGNKYKGFWVDARVDMVNASPAVTVQMPVFAVVDPPHFSGGMMGIRYDLGDPARNPLLNIADSQGKKITSGYTIWSKCIQVGVSDTPAPGFEFIPLTRKDATHWNQPRGEVSLPGTNYTFEQFVLLDTGLNHMLLMGKGSTLPAQFRLQDSYFPAGTPVTVTIPPTNSTARPVFTYGFKSAAPSGKPQLGTVKWDDQRMGINTGILPFAEWAYTFDNARGRVGFKHLTTK